jgi:hypothetical protein
MEHMAIAKSRSNPRSLRTGFIIRLFNANGMIKQIIQPAAILKIDHPIFFNDIFRLIVFIKNSFSDAIQSIEKYGFENEKEVLFL